MDPKHPTRHPSLLQRLADRAARRPGETGFTLIELLVVIIILGILAAVVVFAVGGVGDKGAAAAKEIDRRTLRTAQEAYFARNGSYGSEPELVSGGFLSEESSNHKVYVSNAAGSCPAGSKCEYAIGDQDEPATLVLYNGRTGLFTAPVITAFTAATGIAVTENVAGGSSGLATTLVNEGANTPADVFLSQDAGNLGVVSRAGLFQTAPAAATGRVVNPKFLAADRSWVGVSGRARTIAYNPTKLGATPIPNDVFGLVAPGAPFCSGDQIGYDPNNASFQNFVAAMIVKHGQPATTAWLDDLTACNPDQISGNLAIAASVANGASATKVGLINHYYRFQLPAADQPNVLNAFPAGSPLDPDGHVGSLVNVAGAGILKSTDSPGAAEMFVKYLLSTSAQTHFATSVNEYPLVAEVQPNPQLVPLSQIPTPASIDLNDIDNGAAVALLSGTGHLPANYAN